MNEYRNHLPSDHQLAGCDLRETFADDPGGDDIDDADGMHEVVALALAAIRADGLGHITTFEELHEYVDANMYVNDAVCEAYGLLDGPEWLDLCCVAVEAIADALPANEA